MKNRVVTVLISAIVLFAFFFPVGCANNPMEKAKMQDREQYLAELKSFESDNTEYSVVFYDSLKQAALESRESGSGLPNAIIHYLLLNKGSISGLVWNDSNGNRLIDSGEKGISGVRIYVDNDDSGTFTYGDQDALTDINGQYTISKIKTGIKNVYVDFSTLSGGYEITTSHPFSADLNTIKHVNDANFGMRESSAAISGMIWDQTDNAPISGVVVYVDLNRDDEISTGEPYGTTDSAGNYMITSLPVGTFKVHVNNGTLDVKYHRTPVIGTNPTPVTLVQGGTVTVSMTYIHKATICGTLQDESGNVWENITLYIDLNNNGEYDEGEPTAVTDSSGNYCFNELLPGTYTVQILTDGFNILISPGTVTVGEGENFTGVDFNVQAQPITISGTVWEDDSANGEREPEEKGIAGVTVFLDANRNKVADGDEPTTVTDETGTFSFAALEHGNYYISVDDSELLSTYIPTTAPNPDFREISPGQTYDEAKFGYRRKLAPVNTLKYPTRLSWGGDGNLYVTDNVLGSVFIYDSALNVQSELRGLGKPLGVHADSSGNIYIGSQERKNVEVYNAGGTLLMAIDEGNIQTPNDIAFDRDGNIYILDSSSPSVLVYDPDGNFITAIGSSLDFTFPVSIAINYRTDITGTEISELYVADQPSCSVKVYTLDGTYMRSIGKCGNMYTRNWDGLFSGLTAVDIDKDGNVNGLDNNLNVVQVFDPESGAFLWSYNAYPPENEYRVNLQTDISINRGDNISTITNVGTKNIETINTLP